ncbi:MAG: type II toxin-antitoxin system VapC family toxin [Tepidisphaeraceae bacterium]
MIYLDANVIIRFVEGIEADRLPIEARLRQERVLTSQLSRLECRCLPLKQNDRILLHLYDTFFAGPELSVAEVTRAVIDRATELRARFNFKAPDAIHLASAIEMGADVFLTGDQQLTRCSAIPVELI